MATRSCGNGCARPCRSLSRSSRTAPSIPAPARDRRRSRRRRHPRPRHEKRSAAESGGDWAIRRTASGGSSDCRQRVGAEHLPRRVMAGRRRIPGSGRCASFDRPSALVWRQWWMSRADPCARATAARRRSGSRGSSPPTTSRATWRSCCGSSPRSSSRASRASTRSWWSRGDRRRPAEPARGARAAVGGDQGRRGSGGRQPARGGRRCQRLERAAAGALARSAAARAGSAAVRGRPRQRPDERLLHGPARIRTVSEVGYVFRERLAGESKVTAKLYVDYLRHLVRLRLAMLPARFPRFAAVGLSGVAVDMALLFLLSDPHALGWGLTQSKVLAAEAAIVNNFIWNDSWTFRDLAQRLGGGAARLKRFAKFNLICAMGLALSVLLLALQVNVLRIDRYLANAVAIALVTAWNFWMNKAFSWSVPRAPAPARRALLAERRAAVP